MRDRTTRWGRTDGRPHTDGRIGWRELLAAFGLVALVPTLLWVASYPVLAAGAGALVGGAYALVRIAARIIRDRPWMGRSVRVPGTAVRIEVTSTRTHE
jgi:hypothetical protein